MKTVAMRPLLLLLFVFAAQISFAQLDIKPLTGFTLKQTKKEALEVAKALGGAVPETPKEESSVGVGGMKLFGLPNDLVILKFQNDQLFSIGVFVDAKNAEQQQANYEMILELLKEKQGPPSAVKDNYTFWTMNAINPDSDRIIINRSADFSISVQLINGELLNLSQKEKKQ